MMATESKVQDAVSSLTTQIDTIDKIAQLVQNHGALLTFSITMGILNFFLIFLIVKGRLVPYTVYKKALDEADRLQLIMEKERQEYMTKLLSFMGGLKVEDDTRKGRGHNDS